MAKRSSATLRGFATALGIAFAAGASFADDSRPRWDITEVCASSTLGAKCPKIESDHRRAVLERWQALPSGDRDACMKTVDTEGVRSYRALLRCLEDRALNGLADPHHNG